LVFEFMAFLCWTAAVAARHGGQETPHWAKIGLAAIEDELGPLPTDRGGALQ
jgi:hypothetical protein